MRTFLLGFCLVSSALFSDEDAMAQAAPYGSWKSPITAELIASDEVRLGRGQEVDGVVYFLEGRPKEGGRTALVRRKDGHFEDLLPLEYNVRTRVHEYGGGSLLLVGHTAYFSNDADQQLYRRDPDGTIQRVTNEPSSRFADGVYDESRGLLFYVMEVHGEKVENCLVSIDPKTGIVRRIAEGCDFYASPRISPDHHLLAYYCWNHPNMPWNGTELRIAELNPDGSIAKERVLAGGKDESIAQISWSPDNVPYFISDRSGWWNFHREEKWRRETFHSMEAEFGLPQWNFGQSNFVFSGKDKIVCVYSQNGSDRLAYLSMNDGALTQIDLPFSSIRSLSITGDQLYFIAGAPDMPASLIQYNLKTRQWEILKKSRELNIDPSYLSIPKAVEFPTEGGVTAHAFYYPPTNPKFQGMPEEKPPLLVLAHGGPTAQVTSLFNLEIQYWTSRGIAVIDVNYGGSSGYGRAYRDRLKGKWGVVDVDDCINAALYCVREGLADRTRLAIEGGSAGGYTTLAALTFRDVFQAGASLYGISDLEALTRDTHKFELRYPDQLIGPYPAARDLYVQRSPIHHVEQIKSPIILLQGDEDPIVPPSQSEKMYQSLKSRGIATAYLLFPQEQHGFRRSENIQRAIEAESYFFSKMFGYQLADSIQPIDIANYP